MSAKIPNRRRKFIPLLYILVLILAFTAVQFQPIPVSGHETEHEESVSVVPSYQSFITTVENGDASVIRGVYAPGALALRVQQQPKNNANYVSSVTGIATQFNNAAQFGVTGILAHNFLSGFLFFDLEIDQEVIVV